MYQFDFPLSRQTEHIDRGVSLSDQGPITVNTSLEVILIYGKDGVILYNSLPSVLHSSNLTSIEVGQGF